MEGIKELTYTEGPETPVLVPRTSGFGKHAQEVFQSVNLIEWGDQMNQLKRL